MILRTFLLISAAAAYGAICPLQAQGTAIAASVTRTYLFSPVGLGGTETASITVVNTATASATAAAAPSCTGTISFLNASGEIGTATSFTLAAGQFKTVTLPFSSSGLTGLRGEIEGQVSLTVPSTPTACSLAFSFETYDTTTGATHVVLSSSLANSFLPIPPIVAPGER